jgi:hypothetical protein
MLIWGVCKGSGEILEILFTVKIPEPGLKGRRRHPKASVGAETSLNPEGTTLAFTYGYNHQPHELVKRSCK